MSSSRFVPRIVRLECGDSQSEYKYLLCIRSCYEVSADMHADLWRLNVVVFIATVQLTRFLFYDVGGGDEMETSRPHAANVNC